MAYIIPYKNNGDESGRYIIPKGTGQITTGTPDETLATAPGVEPVIPKITTGPQKVAGFIKRVAPAIGRAMPYAQAGLAGPAAGPGPKDYSAMAQTVMDMAKAKPAAPFRDLPENVPQLPMSGRFGPVIGAGVNAARVASELMAPGFDPAKHIPDKTMGYLVAGMVGPGEAGVAAGALDKVINKGIMKGVRPSSEGIVNYGGIKRYMERARDAVKAIFSNKEALHLTDEFGETTNKLPATLDQFSQAIQKTKEKVFRQYDNMAQAAGEEKARVPLNDIARELEKIANDKINLRLHPEVARYARDKVAALRKLVSMNPEDVQNEIAHANAATKAFQQNPNPQHIKTVAVEALYANLMRKALDSRIEEAVGPGYAELKKTYGALKAIEKDVAHRAIVDARKSNRGLIDFANIGTAAELMKGIATVSATPVTMAAAIKGMVGWYKYLNNPNTAIKNMFRALETGGRSLPAAAGRAAGMGLSNVGKEEATRSAARALRPAERVESEGSTPSATAPLSSLMPSFSTPAYADEAVPAPRTSSGLPSIIPRGGTPAMETIRNGFEAYTRGDYDGAITSFRKAMAEDPRMADTMKMAMDDVSREQASMMSMGLVGEPKPVGVGVAPNGRKIIRYDDGSVRYAKEDNEE